jgi:predicted transposase YbfD/YdcC
MGNRAITLPMPRKTSAPSASSSSVTSLSRPQRQLRELDLSDAGAVDVTELIAQLNQIEDPRQAGKVEYPLQHLLLFALAATLSQYDSFELMASWSVAQGPWLIAHLGLGPLSRMPSHDTFRHLFRLLQPQHLERFVRAAASAVAGPLDQRLVLIDGKALCGTWGPKAKKDAAFKVLNAYLPDLRLTLGTHAVGAHTNESAQLPAFITSLELKGATLCIDAAGTYKPVAAAIHAQQAHYILTLKENQPTLLSQVECFFAQADQYRRKGSGRQPQSEGKLPDIKVARFESRSKGRAVKVKAEVCDWLAWLEGAEQWAGLRSVVRLQRWRVDELGAEHHSTMYLISSLTGAKAILRGAVGRWAIENSLHWVLDVTFDEDACRTRDRNAAHNQALLRRMADNLLKLEPTKVSIKGKRLLCASSRSFLCEALNALNVHA